MNESYINKRRFEDYEDWRDEALKKQGWYMHMVPIGDFTLKDQEIPYINFVTFGLEDNFDHPDLQLFASMPQNVAHAVLSSMVDLIRHGTKFVDGKRYSGIIKEFDIEMKAFRDVGRTVLRVLLPDEKGRIPTDDVCDPEWCLQLIDIETELNLDDEPKEQEGPLTIN